MWEKFIGKRCRVKLHIFNDEDFNRTYEGVVTAIDDEAILMNVEKISRSLGIKGVNYKGLTLIRKTYVVSISIVE